MSHSKENRCAVFAHYDAHNLVDDYVLHYLNELAEIAKRIVFVSDCNLPPEELLKVSTITNLQISGRHGEYDFGSYKRGYHLLKEMDLNQYEELVFCNDSCYGPLSPLSDIWNNTPTISADFWGLTSGRDPHFDHHIQSFFLVFKKRVFTSEIFSAFMNSIKAEEYKMDVVEKYEVGLYQKLRTAGFNGTALFDETSLHVNPSIGSPFEIIEKGFPFLKVDLLRNNPVGVAQLHAYNSYTSDTLQQLIQRNLERTAPLYQNFMHYRFRPIKKHIIHPLVFLIRLKNSKGLSILRVKFLGLQIFKLQLRSSPSIGSTHKSDRALKS